MKTKAYVVEFYKDNRWTPDVDFNLHHTKASAEQEKDFHDSLTENAPPSRVVAHPFIGRLQHRAP